MVAVPRRLNDGDRVETNTQYPSFVTFRNQRVRNKSLYPGKGSSGN